MLGTWRFQGKCFNDQDLQDKIRETRYDPFFDKPEAKNAEWAKQYCSNCPVRLACLSEAMKSLDQPKMHHVLGIWGGMTYRARLASRRKQQKQIRELTMRLRGQFPDNGDPIAS